MTPAKKADEGLKNKKVDKKDNSTVMSLQSKFHESRSMLRLTFIVTLLPRWDRMTLLFTTYIGLSLPTLLLIAG